MYPTTSPSTSVIARSVRGITSPSIEKPVRPSRRATLNEGHPMYASFPIRRARFSPTRCQYWIVPSTPAFSLMSWMSDTRATSSIVPFLLCPIHRVSPPRRGGDETAMLQVREDLPEDDRADPERALQRRHAHGFCGQGGEDPSLQSAPDRGRFAPRTCRLRRGGECGDPTLQVGEPHAEGLDGLPRRRRRQGLLQLRGELLDVPEGTFHMGLQKGDPLRELLNPRSRLLPCPGQREGLVDGVLLTLELDERPEVSGRVPVDGLEEVAHQLVVRHLDLSRGHEPLLQGIRNTCIQTVRFVLEQVGPARLQPDLLE